MLIAISKYLTAVSLLVVSALNTSLEASAAEGDGVVVNGQGIGYISSDLPWSSELLSQAQSQLAIERSDAEAFLAEAAKTANSLTVTQSTEAIDGNGALAGYKYFDRYNHELTFEARSDWGSLAQSPSWSPPDSVDMTSRLVTFPVGTCRLSWSLFNVSTWFSPDCTPQIASPATYLRTALIQHLEQAPPNSGVGYFTEISSLQTISDSRLDYTISDGRIYSDGLDFIYASTGLELVAVFPNGGWKITIDPVNKWHFTFAIRPRSLENLVKLGHFISDGGQTFVSFDG